MTHFNSQDFACRSLRTTRRCSGIGLLRPKNHGCAHPCAGQNLPLAESERSTRETPFSPTRHRNTGTANCCFLHVFQGSLSGRNRSHKPRKMSPKSVCKTGPFAVHSSSSDFSEFGRKKQHAERSKNSKNRAHFPAVCELFKEPETSRNRACKLQQNSMRVRVVVLNELRVVPRRVNRVEIE